MRREETRRGVETSANGTIRQDLLDELERTRTLFELMISKLVHGCKLNRESGTCAMRIKCAAIHGGGANRGIASVEDAGLGHGHEFMHEHEHESYACHLELVNYGAGVVDVTANSVETSH